MQTTTVLAGTLKIGDKISPAVFGHSAECSAMEVIAIHPYGTSFHSIMVLCKWEFEGKAYEHGDHTIPVLDKMQEVEVIA